MSMVLTSEIELLPAKQRTASENGAAINVRDFVGPLKLILSSGAGTGTTPTLDVKVQESDDGTTWTDVAGATFTQVTDAAGSFEAIVVDADALKAQIRAVATLGGTSPVFDCAVIGVGRQQVEP